MSPLVHIVMFGWVPVVIGLFALLPPRRAVLAAFLFAWLFLPMASYRVQGFPNYTKMTATCIGVMLSVMIFDSRRLMSFRLHWLDLPMIVWCLSPFATSISNGLGWYDGASAVNYQVITWLLPYLIGRLYFCSLEGLRELAAALFIGGLIYVPLCLYEIRMSPQLHAMLYGFHQHSFAMTHRFGGWRPTVFMQHGLAVGMWMATASLAGVWLWASGAVRQVRGVWMGWLVGPLVVTTVLVKSTGALALLIIGIAALCASRWLRTVLPIAALVVLPLLYMGTRATGAWSGNGLLRVVNAIVPTRTGSLEFRLENENRLAERALQRPLLGWGGYGRSLQVAPDEYGRPRVGVPDGLWILELGKKGIIGLAALTAVFLLPVCVLLRRVPAASWVSARGAAMAVPALLMVLHMIDNLFNAMVNPIFTLAAGAVTSFAVVAVSRARSRAYAPVREYRPQFAGNQRMRPGVEHSD